MATSLPEQPPEESSLQQPSSSSQPDSERSQSDGSPSVSQAHYDGAIAAKDGEQSARTFTPPTVDTSTAIRKSHDAQSATMEMTVIPSTDDKASVPSQQETTSSRKRSGSSASSKSSGSSSSSSSEDSNDYHAMTQEEVVQHFSTDKEDGLTNIEAVARLQTHGANTLGGKDSASIWKLLLTNIFNPMNLVLGVALALSAAAQDWIESVVISIIIVLNTTISFVQEYRSEKTMAALRKLSSPTARVLRDGELVNMPGSDVVPGDICILVEGDQVPADIRLIEAVNLEIDEAILTGENMPVAKSTEPVDADADLQGQRSMAFKSTMITQGRGAGVVVSTGTHTAIGKIAQSLTMGKSDSTTKLQKQMRKLMIGLLAAALLIGLIVFAVNGFSGDNQVVLYAIAVAVGILPEGLPAVVTVTQSVALYRLGKEKAIVRLLRSLEALGEVTDICSDKTGTITVGKMTVSSIWTASRTYTPTGQGVNPEGELKADDDSSVITRGTASNDLRHLVLCSALCNTSSISRKEGDGAWVSIGDPTEVALLVLGYKMGYPKPELLEDEGFRFEAEMPFDPKLKLMTVVYSLPWLLPMEKPETPKPDVFPHRLALTKGATEELLHISTHYCDGNQIKPMTKEFKKKTLAMMDALAKQGLRVLAFGYKELPLPVTPHPLVTSLSSAQLVSLSASLPPRSPTPRGPGNSPPASPLGAPTSSPFFRSSTPRPSTPLHLSSPPLSSPSGNLALDDDEQLAHTTFTIAERGRLESKMTFVGLVGMYDPPRPESAAAVRQCHQAGILVHMATGDHYLTAEAIAKEVGIIGKHEDVASLVIVAKEFDALTDEQIDALPHLPRVLARCSPESKVKLVNALHRRKRCVVMTGDGVNDAPAVKKADVGVAMGLAGSDVTKQASDIVLTDDNFATIVRAVAEGRRMYANISKFTLHLMTGNIAQVIALVCGLAFAGSDGLSVFPMTAIQILWLNLATSTPPSFVLGLEKASPDLMRITPRNRAKGIFDNEMIVDMLVYGVIMGVPTLLCFWLSIYLNPVGSFNVSNCHYGSDDAADPCNIILRGRATAFVTLSVLLLLHAFNCRDRRKSLFQLTYRDNLTLVFTVLGAFLLVIPTIYIPYLNTNVFGHNPISWEWGLVAGAVVIFFCVSELYKYIKRRFLASPYQLSHSPTVEKLVAAELGEMEEIPK